MSATPEPADVALFALRTQIDGVDRELLGLLNRRAALALQVGELKKRAAAWSSARNARRRSSTA